VIPFTIQNSKYGNYPVPSFQYLVTSSHFPVVNKSAIADGIRDNDTIKF